MLLKYEEMIYNYLLATNSKKGDKRIIFKKRNYHSFSFCEPRGTYIEVYCKTKDKTVNTAKKLLQIIMQDFDFQKMYAENGYIMILENEGVLHIRPYTSHYDIARIEVKIY